MRLGLFGGRFDPPHNGHLLAAQQAFEQLKLDELWFVPAQTPPHKPALATAENRFEMTLLATASHPDFKVSRLEIARPGPSYTFDTLKQLREAQPQTELFFITGLDAYRDIASWYRAKDLVGLAHMVAVSRPGYNLNSLESFFEQRVRVLDTVMCEISSTEIRHRLATQRPVCYLVPELVEKYLVKHDLYRQQSVQPG